MFTVVILVQALSIMAKTSAAGKISTRFLKCPQYDKLTHVALLEHNRRRSQLALGKTKTKDLGIYMWNASFMMKLKEDCQLTNKIRALHTCKRDLLDRSIPGMMNTHMTKARSAVDALRKAIFTWWNEVKTHRRPQSLKIEEYLVKHKQFLPMALAYQEHVSCAVNYCDKHKKKPRTKRKYFVQCIYPATPVRNQNLYEKGPACSKHCYTNRGEKCLEGLCHVPDESNFIGE